MTDQVIMAQVQELDPVEQADLLGELNDLVKRQESERKERSIMELEGLGAEIWEGIDARAYVRKGRES